MWTIPHLIKLDVTDWPYDIIKTAVVAVTKGQEKAFPSEVHVKLQIEEECVTGLRELGEQDS